MQKAKDRNDKHSFSFDYWYICNVELFNQTCIKSPHATSNIIVIYCV